MRRNKCIGFWIGVVIVSCAPVKNTAYTVGSISEFSRTIHSAPVPNIEFYVKGKRYGDTGEFLPGLVIGEKFMVKYDSLNPNKCKAMMDYPLFLPTERVNKTIGTVFKFGKHYVDFSFKTSMGGHLYKKIQLVPGDTLLKYSVKVGDMFEVKFSPDIPKRAVIYFDKPILHK